MRPVPGSQRVERDLPEGDVAERVMLEHVHVGEAGGNRPLDGDVEPAVEQLALVGVG